MYHDTILRRTGRGITVAGGRTLGNAIRYAGGGSTVRRERALHHAPQVGIRVTDDDLRRQSDFIAWCRSGAHPAGDCYHVGWRRG